MIAVVVAADLLCVLHLLLRSLGMLLLLLGLLCALLLLYVLLLGLCMLLLLLLRALLLLRLFALLGRVALPLRRLLRPGVFLFLARMLLRRIAVRAGSQYHRQSRRAGNCNCDRFHISRLQPVASILLPEALWNRTLQRLPRVAIRRACRHPGDSASNEGCPW